MAVHSKIWNGAFGYGTPRFGRRSEILAAMTRLSSSTEEGEQAPRGRVEPSEADLHERNLAVRARTGEPKAFDALVALYTGRIYTHLYRLLRNREEAEDITQETFLRAYRYIAGFDHTRSFRNWLYAIATNAGIDALRVRKNRGNTIPFDELVENKRENTGEAKPTAELKDRLHEAVNRLPARTASLVHLHYYEGMTIGECAGLLGMTESAAKVALHRARRSLRVWLIEDDLR
jgi:RNA polymerase sigma-70 factor (ECF subfamily)